MREVALSVHIDCANMRTSSSRVYHWKEAMKPWWCGTVCSAPPAALPEDMRMHVHAHSGSLLVPSLTDHINLGLLSEITALRYSVDRGMFAEACAYSVSGCV